MKKFLFFILIVLLAVGAVYKIQRDRAAVPEAGATETPPAYTPARSADIDLGNLKVLQALDHESTRLVEAILPSVVSVTTARHVELGFYGLPREFTSRQSVPSGLGSGVIVSEEGHILTNYHVVKDSDEIRVRLNDGTITNAEVIGADAGLDIAVLKVDAGTPKPLPLGNSDEVKVGQMVFAVGSPFGLEETVTSGIISATGRPALTDMGSEFIQTNADINQGNSGGPLVNLRGEIVGINSVIFSPSGGSAGIGFAIPANVARHAFESILKTGRVERGFLGISMEQLTREFQEESGVRRGALVGGVAEDSPASEAGLQSGDVITKVDGRSVDDPADLKTRILSLKIGREAELTFVRGGNEQKTSVTIAKAPDNYFAQNRRFSPRQPSPSAPNTRPAPSAPGLSALDGIDVVEIPAAHRRALSRNLNGVMIARIHPRSAAARVLKAGDIIEEINRQAVRSPEEFAEIAKVANRDDRLLLSIIRGRTRSFVILP